MTTQSKCKTKNVHNASGGRREDRRDFVKTCIITVAGMGAGIRSALASEQPALSLAGIKKTDSACKISARLEMLPGKSVVEQIDNAKSYGFDGVSLPGRYLKDYVDELKKVFPDISLPLISLSLGFEGTILSPDVKVREKCKASIFRLFDLCRSLKIKKLNMPPVLIQDNPERYKDEKRQDDLLISQLYDICEEGKKRDVKLLLEPVNRYETDYLRTLPHTAHICESVNHDYLGITADFYHMMMEELNIPESIAVAGKWIRHVHVAENTRIEPGHGSLDFKPGFEALKKVGYNGYIEIECRSLSGDPNIVYPDSINYLRNRWDSV